MNEGSHDTSSKKAGLSHRTKWPPEPLRPSIGRAATAESLMGGMDSRQILLDAVLWNPLEERGPGWLGRRGDEARCWIR